MESIRNVLQAYQIVPTEIIPITKKLTQIQTHNYTYALKRTQLNRQQLSQWRNVFQLTNQHRIPPILAVYMTQSGAIFQQDKDNMYYLTPWKHDKESDEPEHEVESFYQALGMVHNQTRQKITFQTEQLKQHIQQQKEQLSYYQNQLLTYVKQFEKRHYMSPFELRVCMQYRDIEQVIRYLDDWYDYYLDDITEDSTAFHCLCHGNLRASHLIYQSNQTFLINWEHAHFGQPVSDLANYFYHACKYHDCLLDQIKQSFFIYEKYNPLLPSERSLLAIYLLSPTNYLQVIDKYNSGNWQKSQPFQIKALEHAYRRLMHGLSMQSYLYQVREELQQQQEQAEQD